MEEEQHGSKSQFLNIRRKILKKIIPMQNQTMEESIRTYNDLFSDVSYYIDINCKELLEEVGMPTCPVNAVNEIKNIPNITQLSKGGGYRAVREFINLIIYE